VLTEWKQIYPITQLTSTSAKDSTQVTPQPTSLPQTFTSDLSSSDFPNIAASNSVNRVVEVIVSGFRMKYPFCYVFKTDIDDLSAQKVKLTNTPKINVKSVSSLNSSNSSEIVSNDSVFQSRTCLSSSYQQLIPTHTYLLKSCVSQELSVNSQQPTSPLTKNKDLSEESANNLTLWNITDPCSKNNCTCFRCKAKKGTNVSKSSNLSLNQTSTSTGNSSKKGDKTEKEGRLKSSKGIAPFHRRSPILDTSFDLSSSHSLPNPTSSLQNVSTIATNPSVSSSISQPTSVPTYSYKSPISGGGLPSLQSSATTPTGGNGVDSPRSVSQSLNLDAQSSSVGEQTNQSLSPHPIKDESTNASCNESQITAPTSGPSPLPNNKERTRLEQLLSPNHPSLKGSATGNNASDDSPSIGISQWTPGGQSSDVDSGQAQTSVSCAVSSATSGNSVSVVNSNQSHQTMNGVKRPSLMISTYEDSECDPIRVGLLYDYSHLNDITNNWDIPPPKNRRLKSYNFNEFRRGSVNELYINGRKKVIPGSQMTNGDMIDSQHLKPKDPYEFSDFDEDGPTYKVAQNGIKEEMNSDMNVRLDCGVPSPELTINSNSQTNKDTPKPNLTETSATSPQPKVFTREDELIASYSDLEQIFDTSSGEDSNDEPFQAPLTPSGASNRSSNTVNGTCISSITSLDEHSKSNKNGSTTSVSILGVAELTRMFPTPPSLEPMAPSPCNNFIGPDATIIDDSINPCSPNSLENSKVTIILIDLIV
jgi:hypothetical protein